MKILDVIIAVQIIFLVLVSATGAEEVRLEGVPLDEYNAKLSLNMIISTHEGKGTGYYSVNKDGLLDGPFRLEARESGYEQQVDASYSFHSTVGGRFKKGSKDSVWKYQYRYDDGIDLYEDHVIEVVYEENKCMESVFRGRMGYVMPVTEYVFHDERFCTPEAIRSRAWQLWSEVYQEHKKHEKGDVVSQ
ncbi:MAG: hypothetical protein OEV28_07830 [Nitrospirota bacterium]|nr:hypothetical protein [Nitrospirota bacterium]